MVYNIQFLGTILSVFGRFYLRISRENKALHDVVPFINLEGNIADKV